MNLANALLGTTPPTPVRPANDAFASAVVASTATWKLTGNNTNGTSETGEPAHAGNSPAKSVWWAFTAPSSGTCTVRTLGSAFDTVLAVYTGTSVGALVALASNDNSSSTVLDSTVSFSTVKGRIYRIVVDGKSGASGAIQLAASLVAAVAPVNDTFATATVLTGTSFSVNGSNIGATVQTGEPKHAGITGGKSVWWSWKAPSSGTLSLATTGSSFDTTLGIYTGTVVNTLKVLGSNDDQSTTLRTSKVVVSVVAGTTYRIAVDGYSAASGAITLAGSLVAKAVLATPAGVAALRDTAGRITISWGAVASASSYEVTLTSGNTVYASGQTTGTRATSVGRFPKTLPLVAKVRALSGTGESGPWSAKSAVR